MIRHGVLTLSGSVQLLSDITGIGNVRITRLSLTAGAANAGIVYIGGATSVGNLAVSTTVFGEKLPIPVSSVSPPPNVHEGLAGKHRTSEFAVIGTANDTVAVLVHLYA
jgi:hypothetical protein